MDFTYDENNNTFTVFCEDDKTADDVFALLDEYRHNTTSVYFFLPPQPLGRCYDTLEQALDAFRTIPVTQKPMGAYKLCKAKLFDFLEHNAENYDIIESFKVETK